MDGTTQKKKTAEPGFTLVELVVVIAILGILAGVGYVAYGGYIKYAQKGIDVKLVGEIENAVSLTVQADTSAQGLSDGDNAVPIGTIFMTHPDGENGQPSINDPYKVLNQALTDTFGSDYTSALSLKYDGWKSNGDGAAGFINEEGNRYMDSQELMTYVYGCVDSFFENLTHSKAGPGAGRMAPLVLKYLNGGVNYDDPNGVLAGIVEQAGFNWDKSETSEEVARQQKDAVKNASIWLVADYTKKHNTEIADYMSGRKPLESPLGGGLDSSAVYNYINTYASLGMLVNYMDEGTGKTEFADVFKKILSNEDGVHGSSYLTHIVSNLNTVKSEMLDKIQKNDELKAKYSKYYESGQASKDAKAYVDIMSKMDGLRDQYNTEANQQNTSLFTDVISQEISKFTGETGGILITAMSDGSCVVDPSDASPMDKE